MTAHDESKLFYCRLTYPVSFVLCWLHHRIITITTITITTMTTTTTAVSSVTDMDYMFSEATAFNQPLSTWDGKCRCCLLTAHDESKLFYCRLTYVCRLLCVGCIIEPSPFLRSRRRPPLPPPQCRAWCIWTICFGMQRRLIN